MRCFVALDLPVPVCNYLAGLASQFQKKGAVNWVPPDQLHMTLVFAGELDEAGVAGLREEVRQIEIPPLSFTLASLGHFPPRGEPASFTGFCQSEKPAPGAPILYVDNTAVPGQTIGGLLVVYDAFTNRPLPILDERITAVTSWIPLGEAKIGE